MDITNLLKFDVTTKVHDPLQRTALSDFVFGYKKVYSVDGVGKRLDTIAYEIYGDVDFWIILALMNDITDPFVTQYLQRVYFIPKQELLDEINKGKNYAHN